MAKIKLQIDEERMIDDLVTMANCIMSNVTLNENDLSSFLILNMASANLFGVAVDEDEVFNSYLNVKGCGKKANKDVLAFYSYVFKNRDLLLETYRNILKLFDEIELVDFANNKSYRGYSEKDLKNIILDFYSQYGDNYYNVVKRYFDENRIQTDYYHEGYAGFFSGMSSLASGYLFSQYEDSNTCTASTLVHELGHVIDFETFLVPQQKELMILEDVLVEVPSTCFEGLFLKYLQDNKIDINGSLLLKNSDYNTLKSYAKIIDKSISPEEIALDEYGNVIVEATMDEIASATEEGFLADNLNEEEKSSISEIHYPTRMALIYSLGDILEMYFEKIDSSSKKEFIKVFNNIITSRKEASFEDIIRMLGVTPSDFASLKYIKDDIKDDQMKLKKRYNYYS